MSEPEPKNEHRLEPFRAAFEKKKTFVAERWAKIGREHLPSSISPEAQIETIALATIEQYVAAIVDADTQRLRDANTAWIAQIFAEVHDRALPTTNVQALVAAQREVLFEVGLEIRRAGVPYATDGIRRLIALMSTLARMFDETLRQKSANKLHLALIFEALFQNSPLSVAVAHPDGILRFANPSFQRLLGFTEIVGRSIASLHAPEDAQRAREEVGPSVLNHGIWHGELRYKHANGGVVNANVTAFRLLNSDGKPVARCAIIRDLGPARRAEEERRRLAEEVIAAQKAALEERETPLVPIAEGVLVMPLVGKIDFQRAERMLAVLLQGIETQNAAVVLLDLTGVRVADEESANGIFRATQAARLLGAEVVLTGIGPEIAARFVEVNANFVGIQIKANLRDGVRWALRRMR